MKCTISFEADVARSTGAVLLHIAIVLHQLRINPVSFGWSEAAEGSRVCRWKIVLRDDVRLQELVAAVKATDAVGHVCWTGGEPIGRRGE